MLTPTEFGDINGDCDLSALAKIPAITKSRDLMQRCVDNDLRDIKDAEAAAAQLATLEGGEQVDDSALTDLVTAIATLDGELTDARSQLATLQELDTAAKERETKTASAKEHHEDVVGWLKIAEQFAPDGIQSQILAKALEPINKLLRAGVDRDRMAPGDYRTKHGNYCRGGCTTFIPNLRNG